MCDMSVSDVEEDQKSYFCKYGNKYEVPKYVIEELHFDLIESEELEIV